MALKISVKSQSFHTGHTQAPLSAEAGAAFKEQWEKANAEMKKNKVGSGLLAELIESKDNHVGVCLAAASQPNNSCWAVGKVDHAYYRSIDEPAALTRVLELAASKGLRVNDLRALVEKYATVVWQSSDAVKVTKVTFKADAKATGAMREKFLKCELERFDCLEPGPGVPCFIRWSPTSSFLGDAAKFKDNLPRDKWRTRPPWIGLAHEYIHAWRFNCGRLLFDQATEGHLDEDFVVGVFYPPLCWGKYTENGIRYHAGTVARPFYGTDTGD